jgi:hypothetical protein
MHALRALRQDLAEDVRLGEALRADLDRLGGAGQRRGGEGGER